MPVTEVICSNAMLRAAGYPDKSHEEPMMGIFVRKYSRAVHRNGARRHASSLLFFDAKATPVEKIVQIRPPMKPIRPTNPAAIHGSMLPYCFMTVSTQGRHTG